MIKYIFLSLLILSSPIISAEIPDADLEAAIQASLNPLCNLTPDQELAFALALSSEEANLNSHQPKTESDTQLALALQHEEDELQTQDIDPATAHLIANLQLQELIDSDNISLSSVQYRFAKLVIHEAREQFNQIKKEILAIYKKQGEDVHAADRYIPATSALLLTIAATFDAELSPLSQTILNENLTQLQNRVLNLLSPYTDLLDQYSYNDKNINIKKNYAEIIELIKAQFTRSSTEIGNYANGHGTIIWARFIALAAERLNDPYTSERLKQTIAQILAERAIEGLLTQGGCIQGFVNRGFIGLLTLLGFDLD